MTRHRKEERISSPSTGTGLSSIPGAKGLVFNMSTGVWSPPADICESDGEVSIKIEIPGARQEDMELKLDPPLLVVKGKRRRSTEESEQTYQLMEICYGPFERVFELPSGLETGQIRAEYRDGFLEIHLPKRRKHVRVVPVVSPDES